MNSFVVWSSGFHKKGFKMMNLKKLIGIIALIAIIGFTAVSCSDDVEEGNSTVAPATSGELKITGLAAFNGKYVFGFGETFAGDDLAAASDINLKAETITGGTIANGEVTLKVWLIDEDSETAKDFNKTAAAGFQVIITNKATVSESDFETEDLEALIALFAGMGEVIVNFTDGKGSGVFIPGEFF